MKSETMRSLTIHIITALIVIGGLTISIYGSERLHDKITEIVNAEVKFDLFSGTILVAKDGKIIYNQVFGKANRENNTPNILDTKFNISSVQKTFIATLIMQLVQEGRINLDDPLTKNYPECPWETAKQIRIKHLLNHTSGLGDYRDSEEYQQNAEKYTCISDVLPLVWKYKPTFASGEKFRYSNAGVLLLKGIIEKTTGKKLKQVLEDRIWKPLKMDNTTMYVGGDLLSNKAVGHRIAEDGKSHERVLGEPSAYSGGGIYTTVNDLFKFDQALYGEELLNDTIKKIMFTPVKASPKYSYGWQVVKFGETTVIFHGGGSGGFNSEFRRYPEKGYTIIILSNYEGAAFELTNRIDSMLLGLPYTMATEIEVRFKRGMYFQNKKLYSKAVELFEKNIDGKEPHMLSLYQAARTRILGEFDQNTAIKLLDKYISLADKSTRPSIAAAWWRKGVAYEQLGKVEKAIICHTKCLSLDEGFTNAKDALNRLKLKK